MHKIAVIALIRKGKKILLINHYKRGWDMPGGYVKDNEDLISALKREVLEETGAIIKNISIGAIYSNLQAEDIDGQNATKLIVGFNCEYHSGEFSTTREVLDIMFINPENIKELVKDELLATRIDDMLQNDIKYCAYIKNPYSIIVKKTL